MAIKIVAEIGINHNGNMETCKSSLMLPRALAQML